MSASSPARAQRLFEVLAVVLLSVATFGSAWCGLQATRWNRTDDHRARDAADLQIDAAREFGLATQYVSYDSAMVAQYAQAVSAGDERLQAFYRDSLFRPAFLPTLAQWEAAVAAGRHPASLVTDEVYLVEQMAPYAATSERAADASAEAARAGRHADGYVLTTLLLAAAAFFAGLTTSFRLRQPQVVLLAGAGVLVVFATARLVSLPIT